MWDGYWEEGRKGKLWLRCMYERTDFKKLKSNRTSKLSKSMYLPSLIMISE